MEMDDDACYRAIAARDRRFDGRLFVAVTTTGVYCRPFCPAPTPKRENVRFFPTAAAAQEAGFRPCLRCRPEIAPDLAVWRGTANTVSRALGLIEAGALDDASVEGLSERLGVGGRQLRRLFRQHLGASPVSVAQTRRVLLAKQLIQDTRLPMAEIAAAAGFGSIRRFNETFQRLYRRSPNALRRPGVVEESAAAAGTVSVRLGYRLPYDWSLVVSVLRARAIAGVEAVSADRYARAIAIDGESGVLVVEPSFGNCLKVTVCASNLRILPAVVARVRRVFDLAADPAAISAHLGRDPLLAPLVAARPGLRAPGAWDGFELAVRVLLRRYAAAGAEKLAGSLAGWFGERIDGPAARDEGLMHAFPTPQQLTGADLAAAGVPQAGQVALTSLATAAVADPLILGPHRSVGDAVAQLGLLAGMDQRTVRCIAGCGLHEPDALSDADIDLACAALADAAGSYQPSAADLLARAERWRPWRAHAALYFQAAGSCVPSRFNEVTNDRDAA